MLCKIGRTDKPFSDKLYSTLGGISLYCILSTNPSFMSSFNISAKTASEIVVNSFFNWLYLKVLCEYKTQIILDFHFPPNISRPYSKGHIISFWSFLLYLIDIFYKRRDEIIQKRHKLKRTINKKLSDIINVKIEELTQLGINDIDINKLINEINIDDLIGGGEK